ncbi:MAG: helix-turn-helix domain-containing protein [Thermomicrobiales bacterium]|nr:helix-turn-helix domain-containing protein [Thermomicrobiales bacterium]
MAEAAEMLRVASSTIRRWIREGDLPAYRIGKRRVALKRADLEAMIGPISEEPPRTLRDAADQLPIEHRKLTPEEVERGLAALERAQEINKEILARRGGKPFESSVEIIRQMREERLRELG